MVNIVLSGYFNAHTSVSDIDFVLDDYEIMKKKWRTYSLLYM